jgi:hypothetical protein
LIAFRTIVWLGPLAGIVHNLEEFPAIVEYGQRHLSSFGIAFPSARELLPAVVLADVLPLLAALLAVTGPRGSWRWLPLFVVQAGIFANAFSHIGQTLVFRDYSPGTITAVVLSIPINGYLFRRAYAEGWLSLRQLGAAGALGAVGMPPAILGLQTLGRFLAR